MKKLRSSIKKKGSKTSNINSEEKIKKSSLIKTRSDIGKELEVTSYEEFRIKDSDSMFDYEDEDLESKMIRLFFLKKKGENIKDKINIKKKTKQKENYLSKIQSLKKGAYILENLIIKYKKKLFFKQVKKKANSLTLKIAANFFNKIKKFVLEIYVRNVYNYIFVKKSSENNVDYFDKSKDRHLILLSPQLSNGKLKKFRFNNSKNLKLELLTKKNNINNNNEKKSGIENIFKKIENEKILEEMQKKLYNIKKREKEYNTKMAQKKRKLMEEISLFKKNNNIPDDDIKRNNDLSGEQSNIYSNNSNKLDSFHIDSTIITEKLSLNSKSELSQKNTKNFNLRKTLNERQISSKKRVKIFNEKEMDAYSVKSINDIKIGDRDKDKEKNNIIKRNSVKNVRMKSNFKKKETLMKLSEINLKKKLVKPTSLISSKNELKKSNTKIEPYLTTLNDSENFLKDDKKDEQKDKKEKDNGNSLGDEESEELFDSCDDFIELPNIRVDNDNNYKIYDKINLAEYDLTYKEQFFKDQLFTYDVENIKDKETEKINKEMNKLDIKRKIKEKKKLKEVNEMKGLNTDKLQDEINKLDAKYKEMKKVEQDKIDFNLDNTEQFVKKGKILNIYFKKYKDNTIPRFSIESEQELGAKEIIDFKPLRKEELSRRYFDYYCCFKQRKKIHDFRIATRYSCRYFVDNLIFENLSTFITLLNCILFFVSDPTDSNGLGNRADNYFLIFYTLEAILKINTYSFYSAEDAYIKDFWNILDLFVIVIGFIYLILENYVMSSQNFSGFNAVKAFRILKPLKTMRRFKKLKNLLLALMSSVSRLSETIIVLFFFFLFFAVAGLQMWQGLFYRRCMNLNFGYFLTQTNYLCSFDSDCAQLNQYGNIFICAKGYLNPNNGANNFDNIFNSLITVFIMVTLEGWSDIFNYVSKTFKDRIYINSIVIFVYFHAFIYIGAFYLINLFLAVTNSEFEHIEKSRKELNEKRSFYKLLKSSYDPKEKKNKDKETKKKLQIKNEKNAKSDEDLKNLYFKVKENAFFIHKNKREIPKSYSTVKDIYIMANNNPEELYLEKQRIKDEEKALADNVERRQNEIELRLRKNKMEMEKSRIFMKKITKKKTLVNEEHKNDSKLINKQISKKEMRNSNQNIVTNNANESSEDKNMKRNDSRKLIKNISQGDISVDLSTIIKLKNNINSKLIKEALDDTKKFYSENSNKLQKYKEEQNKIKNEQKVEKQKNNRLSIYEDTLYDVVKKINNEKKEKTNSSVKESEKQSIDLYSDIHTDEKSSSKNTDILSDKNILKTYFDGNSKPINKELSCIDDLMLSTLSENSENNDVNKINKNLFKKNTQILAKKNFRLTKLIINDYDKNFDNLSFENDLINNSIYLNTKRKNEKFKETTFYSLNELEEKSNDSIINDKDYLMFENFNLRSRFKRPHSTLNYIIKKEESEKFNPENLKFNLDKYLKKEDEKDKESSNNKDRRNSYLGFLEYVQYKKEAKELENIIQKDNDKDSSFYSEAIDNTINKDDSLHFLSEESYLSRNGSISVEDIKLLPKLLSEKKIYGNEYLLHENIKKNMDSNKLTQKIRAEVFVRESVNTNINLTTQELKKYYEETNKLLDEQLYVNKKKIRIRNENNCNVSGMIKEINYNKIVKPTQLNENDQDSEDTENEEEKNNINISDKKKNSSKNGETKKNRLELSPSNTKKLNPKSTGDKELSSKHIRNTGKRLLSNKAKTIKNFEDEKNSDIPLIQNQKTMNMLNLKFKKEKTLASRNSSSKILNNRINENLAKSIKNNNLINNIIVKIKKQPTKKSEKNAHTKKRENYFIFKAKSIEKNIKKYPKEDSKKFIVNEDNIDNNNLLTTEQELIPMNLRGKKYYMNYLYNIFDIDLKVKDNFKISHWKDDILGKKNRQIVLQKLPKRTDAFFVFNDKHLNLKKYKYIYYTDYKYKKKELFFLTTKLKYLPLNVIVLMPKRLLNFGKYSNKQNLSVLTMNEHFNLNQSIQSFEQSHQNPLNFRPDSALVSSMGFISKPSKIDNKSLNSKYFSLSKNTSKGKLIMSSAYTKHNLIQKGINSKKEILEKLYKTIKDFNYLTLSHYFLEEDKLYFKFLDQKKKEEIINNRKEKNRKKYNRLNVKNEVRNILLYDLKTDSHMYIKWSGEDVLYNKDVDENRKNWNRLIKSLENFNIIIWDRNPYIKRIQKIRYAFYVLATNDYFEYTILTIVIANSIFMSLEGNLLKPETLENLKIFSFIFNAIYILEYVVKFIGLTPLVYYSDAFTYLDTFIIVFSVVDLATPNNDQDILGAKRSVSSQLQFFRVFRMFRVIRLAKVLRKLKSMRLIIVSIKKSLRNVSYITIILILFIFIFELLGMSILSMNFHFRTLLEGFYSTYQILTIENWDDIFYKTYPMLKTSILYYICWIFIGNYILFNLFISILIQSFSDMELEDEDDLTEDEFIERIYPLPDYLYALKCNVSNNNNNSKVNEKRKGNKEFVNNFLFSAGNMTNSKEGITRFSSSNFNNMNTNVSKLTIESDEEEKSSRTDISRTTEVKEEKIEESLYSRLTLVEKRMVKWSEINKIFKKNNCVDSLYLFSQSNEFRILCMKLINKKAFDKFILLIIILSTLRLILDTFISGYLPTIIFDIADLVFTLIFLLEAIIKIIALGLALDEGSYLRDNWNQLDAIIVLCSFVEFQNMSQKYLYAAKNTASFEFLKFLRLLRTLRPLRLISHNDHLKLIISSLFDSILPICNTLFIFLLVLFMFSIVGISLFYNYFHNCYVLRENGSFVLSQGSFDELLADNNITNSMGAISDYCIETFNGIMDTGPTFKFSNIIDAFTTSYVLSSMEGYPNIMNSYRIYGNSYGIFFVVFILVVSYFFLNLFTGIMFKYFNEAYKKEQKLEADDKKAAKYYDFLTQILYAQSDYLIWKKPSKGSIKYYLRQIVDSYYFENVMLGIIFFNFIMLCLLYENSSEQYTIVLRTINNIITVFFTIELILKIGAYGIKSYFHVSWNIFDFVIVIISYLDMKYGEQSVIDSSFIRSFQLVRLLRVLRVSRVLRLVKALKGLTKLIQTFQWSFTALSYVLFLNIIIYGTTALMGCYLYEEEDISIKKQYNYYYINDYFNFNNFYTAYLLIFRCSTGENWPNIMMEYAYRNDGREASYSYAYFILSNFVTSVILLNLLLMVTLQQYDEFTNKAYNPIEKFNSFINEFNKSWNKFSTEENEGFRIKKVLISQFFMESNLVKLIPPEKNKLEFFKKYVSELKLFYDKEDYVYYHDVIFKFLYKKYGTQIDRENPENNLIFKTEKKIMKQIKTNINKYLHKKRGTIFTNILQNYNLISFNPLTSHLYYKYSYAYLKTFIKFYKERSQLSIDLKERKAHNRNFENTESQGYFEGEEESDNEGDESEDDEENEEIEDNEDEDESINIKSDQGKNTSYEIPNNNLYKEYKKSLRKKSKISSEKSEKKEDKKEVKKK